jgi:hypothetical protein
MMDAPPTTSITVPATPVTLEAGAPAKAMSAIRMN